MIRSGKNIFYITALILLSATGISAADIPHYSLKVKLDPVRGILEGWALIDVPDGASVRIQSDALIVLDVKVDGEAAGRVKWMGTGAESLAGPKKIGIHYTMTVPVKSGGSGGDGPAPLELLSGWYPQPGTLCRYSLSAEMPRDYEAVSEADEIGTMVKDGLKTVTFTFPHPVPDITLIAGRYVVTEELHKKIRIRACFFPGDAGASKIYIEEAKKLIAFYEPLLGEFPFKSFSMVEGSGVSDRSFPSYTLLGKGILKMPSRIDVTLGRQVVRQWLGCHVYAAPGGGDWTEGLSLYLSGIWYSSFRGEGLQFRKKILADYERGSAGAGEPGVRDFFSGRDDAADAAVRGKSAMIFHMLKKRTGNDDFFSGLKAFVSAHRSRYAGWADLISVFPTHDGKDGIFSSQWLDRKGAVALKLDDFTVTFRNGMYRLNFSIEQTGEVYRFGLPLRVVTEKGSQEFVTVIDKKTQGWEGQFASRPLKIIIDEYCDVMRLLEAAEKPPVIASVTGVGSPLVVAPDDPGVYGYAVEYYKEMGLRVKGEKDVRNSDLKENSLIILSSSGRTYRRLFAGKKFPGAGMTVAAIRNPMNRQKSVMLIDGSDGGEIKSAIGKIGRYGEYSLLLFNRGEATSMETGKSLNGMERDLTVDANGVETARVLGVDGLAGRIMDRDVVYIGENHDVYSHHVMQLEIIRKLYDAKGRLIIGMEMFQQPFQEHLDRFIAGETTEAEFLKKSEYFRRWNFDYALYRDILHFARSMKIPVIALNQREEIIKKVSRSGIDSLTADEYSRIPADLDMTNTEYRESMKKVMKSHSGSINFDNFFQSQILWDETMALNTVRAMKKYPGRTMVVLAGNGHLRNSWGIPDRVKRLSGARQAVILNDAETEMDRDSADFILFPASADAPKTPKLQAYLTGDADGLHVADVIKDGPAMKAGILKNDIIDTVNDREMRDVSDLKILFLDCHTGDRIRVKVKRRSLFFFMKEILIDVEL